MSNAEMPKCRISNACNRKVTLTLCVRSDMDILKRYATGAVSSAVAHGTVEECSCYSQVSVLFISVSGLEISNRPSATSEVDRELWAQYIMRSVQESVYNTEGSVNKMLVDDKGVLVLCLWGLPPLSHYDGVCASTLLSVVDCLPLSSMLLFSRSRTRVEICVFHFLSHMCLRWCVGLN